MLPSPMQVQNLSTIYSTGDLMTGGTKGQVYDLFRDRLITPRGFDGIETNNFFYKVEWSPFSLSSGPGKKAKCVLATLTSNFHMAIYTHQERTGENLNKSLEENSTNEWMISLDISKLYNGIMYQKWAYAGEKNSDLLFDEYKSRLYQLSTVDFAWIPLSFGQDDQRINQAFLLTAQANGDILIWWILVSPESGQLTAEPVFSKNVSDDIISTIRFHMIFDNVGIVGIGTNSGTVNVYRFEKLNSEEDITHTNEPKFVMTDGIEIWEKDMMKIDFLEFTNAPVQNILKGPTLNLLIVKHPNYLLSTLVTITDTQVDFKPVECFQSPEGPIVGISPYSEDEFMICHEAGILSLLVVRNGLVHYIEDSVAQITEDKSSDSDSQETYLFNGLAFSQNGVLICTSKNLTCTYDHLAVRDPGRLIILSKFPDEKVFSFVLELYSKNQFCIPKITDVLAALRYHIRSTGDTNLSTYSIGKSCSRMSLEELRLYLWLFKALILPQGDEDSYSETALSVIRARTAGILIRQIETEDTILRRHFVSLMSTLLKKKSLPEYKLEGENAKSLHMIRKYLKSKQESIPPKPRGPEVAPLCPICLNEVIFQETLEDDAVVKGLSWESQTCVNGHQFPICILSLLPCEFPYRRCHLCRATAMMTPTFAQTPVCPFCGDLMMVVPVEEDDEDEPNTD